MPAVTVEDVASLPRLTVPTRDVPSRSRRVRTITTAPAGYEGEGFPVRRAFAGVPLEVLDPFVHMDQMGEVDYGPGEPKGTAWHPHRGFETVTYIIDGIFEHQDSTGGGGVITNGDTQWMTAGSGILHIERPPEHLVMSGGLFHGVQLWVNLPSVQKMVDPRYQDIGRERVTLLASPDGGALVRVIAGDVGGHSGPGVTHTPIAILHATVQPGARLEIPWDAASNGLVYGLSGHGTVGSDGAAISTGQLAVLVDGDVLTLQAAPKQGSGMAALDVLILGGRPIGEPVVQYGPFVMNTRAELAQAYEDFQKGRMGVIPASHTGG
jgi:redox-sensitive bicupin YhaK (pirin superfamily)